MESNYKYGINYVFDKNENVTISKLGAAAPGEYNGKVVGLASEAPGIRIYIVELEDEIPGNDWKCVTIPSVCMIPR